jgi:drug/metabolite transporter (DMT)-like permease
MFAAFLATLLYSLSAVTGTRTARLIGGTEANFWRLSLAAAFLAIYAYGWGQGVSGAGFPVVLLSGCVGFGLGDVSLFQAFPRLGSRLSTLLVQCLAAPLGALAEWLWMGTTLTTAEVVSGLTILAGVALALAPSEHVHIERRRFIAGVFWATLAAVGQGGATVLSRKAILMGASAGNGIDGITAAYQRLIGGLIVAGICLLVVKRSAFGKRSGAVGEAPSVHLTGAEKWKRSWYLLVANALTGPTLGVSCFQTALNSTPSGVVLPIVAMTPLVVVPLAMRLEGERPGRRSHIGGLLAVAGAIGLALSR